MVRTRGLGRALGRVIGKALGREDRHDSNDAPQWRRPTASAHRQRGVVPIVEDDPMVAVDVHQSGADAGVDVHPLGAEAASDEPEGFLGRPTDPSVLIEYAEHVATNVWTGEVFIIFNLSYLLSMCYY